MACGILIAPSFPTLPVISLLMVLTPTSGYAPGVQELPGGVGNEFRAAESSPHMANVCRRTLMSPVAPSLASWTMYIIAALVMKIVCTYALEGVALPLVMGPSCCIVSLDLIPGHLRCHG